MGTNEFIVAKRLADSARHAIKKLDKTLYKSMTPSLAEDLQLDELSVDVRTLPVMLEHFTVKHRFWNTEWPVRVCAASEGGIEEGISPRFNASAAANGVKNEAPAGWKYVVQVDRFAIS